MIKCICDRNCQTLVDGFARFFHAGDVDTFEKCPPHWRPLETVKVNFLTAGREELMAAKWKVSDAAEALKDAFGYEMVIEANTKKSEYVDQVLEARK